MHVLGRNWACPRAHLSECNATLCARVGPVERVSPDVPPQVADLSEAQTAVRAGVWLLTIVVPVVNLTDH